MAAKNRKENQCIFTRALLFKSKFTFRVQFAKIFVVFHFGGVQDEQKEVNYFDSELMWSLHHKWQQTTDFGAITGQWNWTRLLGEIEKTETVTVGKTEIAKTFNKSAIMSRRRVYQINNYI